MKVVLIKDVENLGKAGDVKDVADGFARNFLIPNSLVKPATERAVAEANKISREKETRQETQLQKMQEVASQIDGQEVIIRAKAKEGKLFGAIKPVDITNQLKQQGNIEISENNIKIKEPIKETGEYSLKVELDHGLEAEIKVIVEAEE